MKSLPPPPSAPQNPWKPKPMRRRGISSQAAAVPGSVQQVRHTQVGGRFVLDDPFSERFTNSANKILDQREVYPAALHDFYWCDNPCGFPCMWQNYGPFTLAGEERASCGAAVVELPKQFVYLKQFCKKGMGSLFLFLISRIQFWIAVWPEGGDLDEGCGQAEARDVLS